MLGWQIVYEADDEVVIVPAHVTEESIRSMPWAEVGPGIVFVPVPEGKTVKNRLHIDLAPHTSDDRDAEIARLVAMGAARSTSVRTTTSRGTCSPTPRATSSASCRHATPDRGQRSSGAISSRSALRASAVAIAAARSTTAVK